MSRALDEHVKEALKTGDHEKIYDDISQLLTTSNSEEPLDIEILGSSHPLQNGISYLRDEEDARYVAIPKLRIVQAFIVARKRLIGKLRYEKKTGYPTHPDIMEYTAVILLMDPEHLTAANTRKRAIKRSMARNDASATKKLLKGELHFLRSLLTSHLHRHTKSPTLWSHRRWVIDQARASDPSLLKSLTDDLTDNVFISAERHPRNYYAWSHARYLVEVSPVAPGLGDAVEVTKKWCFKHHDDVSGWMYLLFVMDQLQAEKKRSGTESCGRDSEKIFEETVNLAKSFRWRNESVWYFLRNFVSSGLLGDGEKEAFRTALGDLEKGASPQDVAILRRAGTWLEQWSG